MHIDVGRNVVAPDPRLEKNAGFQDVLLRHTVRSDSFPGCVICNCCDCPNQMDKDSLLISWLITNIAHLQIILMYAHRCSIMAHLPLNTRGIQISGLGQWSINTSMNSANVNSDCPQLRCWWGNNCCMNQWSAEDSIMDPWGFQPMGRPPMLDPIHAPMRPQCSMTQHESYTIDISCPKTNGIAAMPVRGVPLVDDSSHLVFTYHKGIRTKHNKTALSIINQREPPFRRLFLSQAKGAINFSNVQKIVVFDSRKCWFPWPPPKKRKLLNRDSLTGSY